MSLLTIQNYLNGAWQSAASGATLTVVNPATAEPIALIPDSGIEEVQMALRSAEKAAAPWALLSADQRADFLEKIADLLSARLEEFALAESQNTGKPLSVAQTVDIPRSVTNLRFFARSITQFSSESHHMPGLGINYTLRKPVGIVGCISPWNLPLYLFTWKIAPALAAGNVVIAKPSEVTPLTAYMFSALCMDAGLPPGVLNILHGRGGEVGQAIVEHPAIKAISFTGGTTTGKQIAATAAPMFKKLSLELGGKNPTLIFDDCDLDNTLSETLRAAFSNQGQICLCGSRIYIQRGIYQTFRDRLVEKTNRLQVGDPLDPKTHVGALVSESHLQKVESYIRLAVEEGGTVLTGGNRVHPEGICQPGAFLRPAIIEGLSPDCRVQQEEIFGPVVTLTPFDTEEEALQLANNSPYGLSASIWTQDIRRAHRLAEQLEAGIVWINSWMIRDLRTPFGGVKQSGVGREGGVEALRFFTEPKNVFIRY